MPASEDELDALLAAVAATPDMHVAGAGDLLIGRTLGRFVLVDRLGKGGMGVVYRARDPQLNRDVAVKVLAHDAGRDPARRARFLREAQAAAALAHANIAAIHDVGFSDTEQIAYLAMELVPGRDLRHALAEGTMPIADVERIALHVARGLARAHAAGIVHRDLKPENVMLTHEGDAKILDFGLAKIVDRAPSGDGASTQEGMIVGTPGYMAPEQVLGKAVDARADIFSFGVLVHEMLTGKAPFTGDTPMATALAVTRDPPAALTRADAPPRLRAVVTRCLDKDPAARFADGRDLLAALVNPVLTVDTPAVSPLATVDTVPQRQRALPRAALAFVVVAAAAAGTAGAWRAMHGASEPLSLASIPIVSDDASVQATFRGAALAFYDGDTDAFARAGEQVLKREPDAVAAHLLLTVTGDAFGALKRAGASAARRPPSPAVADALAFLEELASNTADATQRAAAYDTLVERWPREYFLQVLLLEHLVASTDDMWRIGAVERLRALDDGPPSVTRVLSVALRRAGRTEEALVMIDAALAKHPEHEVLLEQKAEVLQTKGDITGAIALMESVVLRRPRDHLARYMLLDLNLMTGDDDARHKHIAVLRSGAFPQEIVGMVLLQHGIQLMARAGRIVEGEQTFNVAIEAALAAKLWPMAVRARVMQMDLLALTGAWDRVAELEPALDGLAAAPEVPEALRKLVQLAHLRLQIARKLRAGDVAGARALLTRIEALDDTYYYLPRRVLLGGSTAIVLAGEGKADEAAAALAGARVDPETEVMAPMVNAYFQLSVAHLLKDTPALRRHGAALAALADECLALQSDDKLMCRCHVVVGTVTAAELAHEARDDDEARRLLAIYDRVWPSTADAPLALRARSLRARL